MPDLVSLGALLTSIKTATEIAQFFRTTDLNLQKAESKARVADLISALADMKLHAADLQGEILARENEIRDLKARLSVKGKLRFERPYYVLVDEGKENDGPFCQHCKDKNDMLIRLHTSEDERGRWFCNVCNNVYYDKNYVEPTPQGPSMEGWI